MLDTVHVALRVELDIELFDNDWGKVTAGKANEDTEDIPWVRYSRKLILGDAIIFLKYFPQDYSEKPLLYVEISSIPKILGYPDGYLLDDISHAITKLNKTLRGLSGFPEDLDIWEGRIRRIDYCFHFNLGENINSYIDLISYLYYPHRSREVYANDPNGGTDNGVRFYCTSSQCKFYDKGFSSSAKDFQGVLRMESSLCRPGAFKRALDLDSPPKLNEINSDMLKALLLKDLHVLGLDLPYVVDANAAFDLLEAKYGTKKALVLRDTLEELSRSKEFSIKQIGINLGVGKSTVYKRISEIKRASLVPALNMSGKRLSPLTEFLVSDLFPENTQKCVVIPRNAAVDHSTRYLRPGAS